MFCDKGQNLMAIVNRWRPNTRFTDPFKNPVSFKGSFNGRQMYYVVPSNFFYNFFCKPAFEIVSHYLKFKYDLTIASIPDTSKVLYEHKDNFAGCILMNTYARYQWADFSYLYIVDGILIYSAKPQRGFVWYSFVKPFDKWTWTYFLISIPVAAVVLYVLYFTKPLEDRVSLYDCSWGITQIVCWDSIKVAQPNLAMLWHLSGFMLCTFVLIAAYTGLLTSFLVYPPYLWDPIDTIEQYKATSMKWFANRAYTSYFSSDPVMKSRSVALDLKASKSSSLYEEPLKNIMKEPSEYVLIGAGVTYDLNTYFMDTEGNIPFHISNQRQSLVQLSYFFQKNALYQEKFNKNMMAQWESGVMFYLEERKNFNNKLSSVMRAIREKRHPPLVSDGIQLTHVTGAFMILFMGYISGSLSFVVENLKRVKQLKYLFAKD